VHTSSSLTTSDTVIQYKRFFTRILELRDKVENPPFVRELDTLINRIKCANTPIRSQENTPMAILNFDCEGNVSTFSPELLTMTDPNYGNFIFGNVFDRTLEELSPCQKFIDINALIREGVSKCKQTCQYFVYCGGGAPANKLYENKRFDSTETVYCRLGKQALMDVVLDYLESKYGLQFVLGSSLIERVSRLQEKMKLMGKIKVLSRSTLCVLGVENVKWKDFDDWDDWMNWSDFSDWSKR
jgi:uncharacterized protein